MEKQEIINEASPLDSISVYTGDYYENIIINKTISLNGVLNVEETVLYGDNSSPTIFVGSDVDVQDVEIDGLTITGGNNCIKTGKNHDVSGLIIANCIIEDPDIGVALYIDPNNYSDIPPIRDGTDLFGTPVYIFDNVITGGFYYKFWSFELYGININTLD